ncbi:MAG: hypothetical protein ACMUIU_20050 [bacterium]
MKKEIFCTITLIIPVLLLLNFPAWPVPGLINYQGKLTDPNGISLNGLYIMKFYLYNVESDGSPLWNEQQDVTVTNGIYNVELGKISSFPLNLFDNENLYLEVEISGTGMDGETFSPRQRLTSTPFAMMAGKADMVDGFHGNELEESVEIDNKIAIHGQESAAHHIKTTSFTDLTDIATDDQIPDDITVNYAKDADKVDGKHASEFGDGHSLDAADGTPKDVVYVDDEGNLGIGTTNPGAKLDVRGDLAVDGFADFFGMNWNEKVGWKWNATGWATVVDYSGSGVLVMVQGFNGHYVSNTRLRITIDGVIWKDYTGSSGSGSVGANGWDIVDDSYDENAAIITLIPFKKFLTSLKVEIYNANSNAESGARVNYLTSAK